MLRFTGIALALSLALNPAQATEQPASASASAAIAIGASVPQQFAALGDLPLESKNVIQNCKLGYRTLGKLNATKSNAVVFIPWHTGKSIEALGLLGPKGLFNPAPYFVIIIDPIGNGVSCSPSNSGRQHGTAFPDFNIRDMVESEHRLLTETLGLKHVHAMIGYSMGGMQVFQWAVSHPDFMDVAVPIAASPHQTSYDMLFWRTEEMAILSDPDYADGKYTKNPNLELYQRIFAMNATSPAYRVQNTSPAGFEKFLQETDEFDPESPDANDMRWQIRAFLKHDIGSNGAKKVKAKMHIINSSQDHMVNPAPAIALGKQIGASVTVLDSNCGHSGLGCDLDKMRPLIERALKGH